MDGISPTINAAVSPKIASKDELTIIKESFSTDSRNVFSKSQQQSSSWQKFLTLSLSRQHALNIHIEQVLVMSFRQTRGSPFRD
jgi:hypothetical protein